MLSPATRMSVTGAGCSLPIMGGVSQGPAPPFVEVAELLSVIESVSMCWIVRPSIMTSMLEGGAPSVRSIHSRGWLGFAKYS